MAKLTLTPAPTFRAKVDIPVAGSKPVPVEFEFKHRTKSDLDKFMQSRAGVADLDSIMEMVVSWDLAEPFDRDAVTALLENYAGSAIALYVAYVDELLQAKRKN
jgi:hypothetical protein